MPAAFLAALPEVMGAMRTAMMVTNVVGGAKSLMGGGGHGGGQTRQSSGSVMDATGL